uniref:Uncharacterized protein n=1 Tax=Phytophthora ramorum TaxID=164328 RepID=H3HCW9_PHYRM
MSSKNLVAVAAASTGQDAWKAFKVAHRTNKILAKTRKVINMLTRQNGSMKNVNDGEDTATENDADADENDEGGEEARAAAVGLAKLMEAKSKFQREVLDDDAADCAHASGGSNGLGDAQSGAEDFWRLYKGSSSLLVLPVLDLKRPSRYERANQALCYDNYYFGDKRAEALGDALHLLPVPVQTLSMKNVGVSGTGSSAILSGIPMRQLKHLNFSENRLGAKGILTIHKTLENPQIHLKSLRYLDISSNHVQANNLEGTVYGGGTFNLNLSERSDGILLRELLQLVWKGKSETVDTMHNGAPFNFNRKDEKAMMTSIPSQGYMQIKVQPNYDWHEELISTGGFDRVTPSAQAKIAHAATEEIYDCASMDTPNEFFEDKDADGKIDSHVEQKVGKWISFNVNNPSGRYQLNMANSIDRCILMRILEHGLVAQPLQGGFRNMRLNHLAIVMGTCWQFPRLGILEFDFVMTRRPYAICTALNDGAFEQFLKEFKQLQVTAEMKLVGLRSISTLYYFTCSQAQRIMEHFGTFERDPTTGCLFRGEVFIVLFSRIVDEWNLSETLSLLDLTTKTQVLDRLVLLLIKLAASGEAELTNAQLNGDSIESDVWKTWTSDDKLPAQGVLSCSMRAVNAVQSEAQLPPTSVRKKLLQSLLFKLEDKAHEPTLL